MAATLSISILADASKARKALGDTGDDLDKFSSRADSASGKFGSSMADIGKAVAVVGAVAAAGFAAIAASAWSAAEESQKIARETDRVIKTTQGAAKITADEVGDLASALSGVQGVDDEVIQGVANLLLTFTNVKNEVGEGNDVFSQATALASDMASVLGTDASGAAIQLGKALNDPAKGITALSKAGVSFTQDQKDQIKVLQESGDVLGAQKIVLGELAKEFGGAAAAAATPLDRLKILVGNAQESLGNVLIPIVAKAAEWLGEKLPLAMAFLAPLFAEISGGITAFGAAWGNASDGVTSSGFAGFMESAAIFISTTLIPKLGELVGWLKDRVVEAFTAVATWWTNTGAGAFAAISGFITDTLIPKLTDLYNKFNDDVLPKIKEVGGWVKDQLVAAFKTASDFIKDTLLPKLTEFSDWARNNEPAVKLMGVAVGLLALAFWAAVAPVSFIVVGLGLLAGGLVWAYQNVEPFRGAITTLWTALNDLWNNVLKPFGEFLWSVFRPIWEALISALTKFYDNVIKPLFQYVKDNREPFEILAKILGVLLLVAVFALIAALTFCVVTFAIVVAAIVAVILVLGVIMTTCWRVVQVFWDLAKNIQSAIGDAARWVGERVGDIVGFFTGMPGRIGSVVSGMFDGIMDAFRSVLNWVIDHWNDLRLAMDPIDVPFIGKVGGFSLDTPNIPRMAAGGIVTRPTLLVAGEAGDEAIIPLSALADLRGGTTVNVTIQTTGLGSDSPQIARDVVRALRNYEARNGKLNLT